MSKKGEKQSEDLISRRIAVKGSDDAKKHGRARTEEEKEHLKEINSGENGYWFGKKRTETDFKSIQEELNGKKVQQFNRKTNELIGDVFPSISEAARITGVHFDTINKHCKKNVKQFRSDISWKYID